jgi:hypothetical protein
MGAPCYTAGVTDGRHTVAEETSLELHRVVAERLRADPSLIERARRRVDEWLRDGTVARPYALAWHEILSGPAGEVAGFSRTGDRARQLRQTSPRGFLDPRTRWAVWRQARRRGGRPNRAQLGICPRGGHDRQRRRSS